MKIAATLLALLTLAWLAPAQAETFPCADSPTSGTQCASAVPQFLNAANQAVSTATPAVSASAESNHVFKAAAGNVISVSATNLTATSGFLVLLNSATAPGDGAITPLACAPLNANGAASISYAGGPPGVFSTGVTAVVTSAATCFTKTTGVITALFSGIVL